MMRRRTRMQDGLALLKVNINSLTEEGGVNLVPSTHAKPGFAEGQSVQGVMWAKDFIVWCFKLFGVLIGSATAEIQFVRRLSVGVSRQR